MVEAKLCWSSWPGACISTQKLCLAPRPNFWRRWSRLIITKTKWNRRDGGFVWFPDRIFRARSSLATRLGGNYGMVGQSTCVCDYFYWHGLQQNAAEQSTSFHCSWPTNPKPGRLPHGTGLPCPLPITNWMSPTILPSGWKHHINRAGASSPVGPVLAGPIFWRNVGVAA